MIVILAKVVKKGLSEEVTFMQRPKCREERVKEKVLVAQLCPALCDPMDWIAH